MSTISLFSWDFCQAREIVPSLLEHTGLSLVTDDEMVLRASELSSVSKEKIARTLSAKRSISPDFGPDSHSRVIR